MKYLLKFFIILIPYCLFLGFPNNIHAQDSTLLKTTLLDDITIYGLKSLEFSKGSHQYYFDSVLNESKADNIATFLQKHSAVYIKEYGNNMLATVSLRGTGPGHTSTLWNGLSISSPTLGQFDFSQAPTFVTDELILQLGGSSALFGTESIGGTILMQSQPQWDDNDPFVLYQDVGSFGTFNTRASFRTNSESLESVTKAYLSHSKNNFPYRNILLPGAPVENQRNARIHFAGIVQDLYWQPAKNTQLSLHTWYHGADRQIQPSMSNTSSDNQEDRNFRIQAVLHGFGNKANFSTRIGFIHDYMLYNESIITESNQLVFRTDWEADLNKKLSVNTGATVNHTRVNTHNYNESPVENRFDLYSWFKYQPFDFWSLTGNLRISGTDSFASPVSPSLGSEVIIMKSKKTSLVWNTLTGINYRNPTLNDRFWNPGGNPDLKAEKAKSIESGFSINKSRMPFSYQIDLVVYNMWIDNWIIWLPAGNFWSPDNLREVVSSGVELDVKGILSQGDRNYFLWNAHYAFTKSTNQRPLDRYDRSVGNQLPYVPYHNLSVSMKAGLVHLNTGISANYTGKRFISIDNSQSLDGFWLVDMDISSNAFKFFVPTFRISNILNTTYYHLPLRPMPGRNYNLSISITLNN